MAYLLLVTPIVTVSATMGNRGKIKTEMEFPNASVVIDRPLIYIEFLIVGTQSAIVSVLQRNTSK